MAQSYIPERGDIVWLEFNPQAGYEQAGHRPALVVSPRTYNEKVGLALFCPITSNVKGYPFEVVLPEKQKVSGAILSDQIKSLDWRVRKAKRMACAPQNVLEEVMAKILTLLGFESRQIDNLS
jgi:mRNA interferase MazF